MVGILAVNVERSLIDHPTLPPELIKQVDLNTVTFISNDHLIDALEAIGTKPEHISRVGAHQRRRAAASAAPVAILFSGPGVSGDHPDRRSAKLCPRSSTEWAPRGPGGLEPAK